jgi:hypothetical protein
MQLRILTFCRGEDYLFGNTLVFKTLRTGFPTAEVMVYDNASDPACAEVIHKAARKADCAFKRYDERMQHADWVDCMVTGASTADEPLVILDPDVVFWQSVEGWKFPAETLLAGRLIPRIRWQKDVICEPRLHTSFLWFPKPKAILELSAGKPWLYDWHPFHGSFYRDEAGTWHHVDTAGALFSAVREAAHAFTEVEMDAYDHLWGGTCPDYYAAACDPDVAAMVLRSHADAKEDLQKIRGLWKYQEAAFKRWAPAALAPPIISKPAEVEMHRRWAQGNEDAADLIDYFGYATQLADDLVDLDRTGVQTKEGRSAVMADLLYTLLNKIPGNRFFRQHEAHFVPLFVNGVVTWDASNTWAKADKKETRMFAYVMREACGRLVEYVAYLVGGFQWSKQVAREIHDYYHGEMGIESFDTWDAERRAQT